MNGTHGVQGAWLDKRLSEESAVEVKYLKSQVPTIRYIDQAIICDMDGMDGIVELLWWRAALGNLLNVLCPAWQLDTVVGLISVCTPVSLVFARLPIENDDPAIAVAVRHEQLVRRFVEEQISRATHVLPVAATGVHSSASDLHKEIA